MTYWKLHVVRLDLQGMPVGVEVGTAVAVVVGLDVVVWTRCACTSRGMMAWRWRALSSTLEFRQREFFYLIWYLKWEQLLGSRSRFTRVLT